MEREGLSAEERLDRVEKALAKQTEALDAVATDAREARVAAEHMRDIFNELMSRDDSGSSTVF